MNTNVIKNSKTKSLPNLPILSVGKTKRVMTKHFCNLPMWNSADEIALLNWLVYQSKADNTFKYSTLLIKQYLRSVGYCVIHYGDGGRTMNLIKLRQVLLRLIEKGLIFNTGNNQLMINPMLAYSADIVNNKTYEHIQKKYQSDPAGIAEEFKSIVAKFLESKKKNYTYNQNK